MITLLSSLSSTSPGDYLDSILPASHFLALTGITIALSTAWILWKLYPRRLAVHNLPGPPSPGWLVGNLDQFATTEAGDELDRLFDKYGPTIVFADLFGKTRISSMDPSFINHVLKDSIGYQKDDRTQSVVRIYAPGTGVFSAEGDMHKRQRRVILPVFSHPTIAQFNPLFLDKSYELKDRLLGIMAAEAGKGEGMELDMVDWTRRLTYDIIGISAFDYEFNSIQNLDDELYVAYHRAFDASDSVTPWVLLQTMFPILRQLRTSTGRTFLHLERVMNRIAKVHLTLTIVKAKKAAVLDTVASEGKHEVKKDSIEGINLIAKIVRANLAADVPVSQRLTDQEVADQVGVFMLAGSVTTATALAWLMYAISEDPKIQTRLRDELLRVAEDQPSPATLDALPYLDAAVRETLRLYCPATDVIRVATKDADAIPLSQPVLGRDGKAMNEVVVERGVEVVVSLVNVNRSKAVWGEDAHEFRPERWLSESPVSAAAKKYDSAWGGLMTFSAGPRSCLGYRFAIEEFKAMTFVLVRAFEYAPTSPAFPMHRFSIFAQTPKHKDGLDQKDTLPLILTPYQSSSIA